jgi:hypothetical protein
MPIPLHRGHEWLGRLVGDWTWEMEAEGQPGQPPIRDTGTESVRSLHGAWVLCEAGGSPGGSAETSIMTLGYDPDGGRFRGTFISSSMTHLWLYEGSLDPAGQVLTLETEGPSYTGEGGTARYRDTIEIRGDGERVQTSAYHQPDGGWHTFLTIRYRRGAVA